MDIRPADLGEGFAQEVIVSRGKGLSNPLYAFHYRLFHRRQTKLSQEAVLRILEKVSESHRYIVSFLLFTVAPIVVGNLIGLCILHLIFWGRIFVASSTLDMYLVYFVLFNSGLGIAWRLSKNTRSLQKAFTDPLTSDQAVKQFNRSEKEHAAWRSYATLVMELVREQNVAPTAQPALRDALRFIGEAVYKLTHTRIPFRSWDKLAEQQKLATLKAGIESDPIVKAALLREAESYGQAIASAQHNALLRRRNEALLNELHAQIEALRMGIPAFYANSGVDTSQLSRLSENARTVAAEAMSQFHARVELDNATESVVVGTGTHCT